MVRLFKNKYIISFFLLSFCNFCMLGCSSAKVVTSSDYESVKVVKIEKIDGQIINFRDDPQKYAVISGNAVVRTTKNKVEEIIPLSEIKIIYERNTEPDKIFYWTVGIIFGLGLVLALIFAPKQPYGG